MLAIAIMGGLGIAAQVFQWRDYWKSAAQPYATVLTGLAVLSAAALALYNGERQRAAEHLRWTADQRDRTLEGDRLHDREVTRELHSRFTTATEQLADGSATIRRAGAHALAALADDWHAKVNPAEVVVCLDVLTGYLKTTNAEYDDEAHSAGPDGAVRATIVAIFTERRRSHAHWRGEVASMEGADLRGVDFSRMVLSGANLGRVDLRFAQLTMCALVGANLDQADLSDARMSGTDLSDAYLMHANFDRADLRYAKLVGAKLVFTAFSNTDMTMANLTRAVGNAKFTDTNLSYANLSGADLSSSYFGRAEVNGADVSGARLTWATFGSMKVGGFRNLHLAILSDQQREKYAELIEKSREHAELEAIHGTIIYGE